MNEATGPAAILAAEAPERTKASNYPEPYASMMAGRTKQSLSQPFELTNFGVNRTTLAPGSISALRHAHAVQDEFVYVLEGHPTVITNAGETRLSPGMCIGFKAGSGDAHQLVNQTDSAAVYLEVGDRKAGDSASYPDDDIQAVLLETGSWAFLHKDGTPY